MKKFGFAALIGMIMGFVFTVMVLTMELSGPDPLAMIQPFQKLFIEIGERVGDAFSDIDFDSSSDD